MTDETRFSRCKTCDAEIERLETGWVHTGPTHLAEPADPRPSEPVGEVTTEPDLMSPDLTCVCSHPHGECVTCGCVLLMLTEDDVRERGIRKLLAHLKVPVDSRATMAFLVRRLDEARGQKAALRTRLERERDEWIANYKSAVHHMGAEADNRNRRIAELEAALAAERERFQAEKAIAIRLYHENERLEAERARRTGK